MMPADDYKPVEEKISYEVINITNMKFFKVIGLIEQYPGVWFPAKEIIYNPDKSVKEIIGLFIKHVGNPDSKWVYDLIRRILQVHELLYGVQNTPKQITPDTMDRFLLYWFFIRFVDMRQLITSYKLGGWDKTYQKPDDLQYIQAVSKFDKELYEQNIDLHRVYDERPDPVTEPDDYAKLVKIEENEKYNEIIHQMSSFRLWQSLKVVLDEVKGNYPL